MKKRLRKGCILLLTLALLIISRGTTLANDSLVQIAAGRDHTVALKNDGTVWDWGGGWLGNGTSTSSYTPVKVLGFTPFNVLASVTGGYGSISPASTSIYYGNNATLIA
jgi:hypothetical protein